MNMLIRFFIMMALVKAQLASQKRSQSVQLEQLLLPIERRYRILPHDMGFRHHLPNYRYLSFIELNITQWLAQLSHQLDQDGLIWIIAMQEMLYLKEVKFLDKLTIKSNLEGWDDKYVYFQHHFFVKNTLMAIGMTKVVLINKSGKLAPAAVGMTGQKSSRVIESWVSHQSAIKSQGQ